jgi:hypothetical protein
MPWSAMLIGTNSLLLQNKLEHFLAQRHQFWVKRLKKGRMGCIFTVYVGKEQLRSVAEAFFEFLM